MKKKELYRVAFMEAMKCRENDFKLTPYYTSDSKGPMLADYNGARYLVNSLSDLHDYAEDLLTDELAMQLPPYMASTIMEEVHTLETFYDKLTEGLSNKDLADLTLVLGIHNISNGDFWSLLKAYTDPLLYAKAVNIGAEIYDLQVLKNELVTELIEAGGNFFSTFEEGTFIEIFLGQEPYEDSFYIYDVE